MEAQTDKPATPPPTPRDPVDWVRKNLVSTWYNALITLAVGALVVLAISSTISWIANGDFTILVTNLRIFMVGQFPKDELWRSWVSLILIMAALGIGSGTGWRRAQGSAAERGLPTEPHSWIDMVRRFWAAIGIVLFFVSFARTLPPYLGVAAIFATFVATRELGRRVSPALRDRGPLVAAMLGLFSLLALAGTSGMGALSMGLLIGWWAKFELARRAQHSESIQWAAGIVVAIVVWIGVRAIGMEGYGWDDWGGLHLSLFITTVGIAVGLPIGVLLALGRQSKLPIIKGSTVMFIEFVRGVPLISLLLFSTFMLPLFVPIDLDIPGQITRAMIVVTAFSAAYIAEIVRGGLQAVPRGQIEAAQATGMSPGKIQGLIVLP
ncbi:MAG: ABC transporter permease subunit, partial [Actinomycetota bacterium]|nr:ABC transporter permease subunit [Actinomycetota bacterium]